MMGNKLIVSGLCLVALSLSGCDHTEENNARMARGCEAAAKVMFAKDRYDRQIDSVTSKKYGMSDGFSLVTLGVATKNKEYGYDAEETIICKFEETSSMAGYVWSASLVQLKLGEDVYGSDGGEIFGDMNDQMTLMDAVQAAMK